ncbi:hypothetical protein NQ315_010446 [Exocentrus adspersus]|uniref:Serpin domain-containing protein n=1 Tax=Exocentrus adspersus TaxID=1586481 RepID=A0AAV8WBJ9_9CUCU|nr:hypothetical protein NQ315_010446 [Exocentrus adspersus]
MEMYIFAASVCFLIGVTVGGSQQFSLSDSVNAFGVNLLGETVNQAGDSINIALSTYTVWYLMSILAEGSRDNTARQLENTLKIPQDKSPLRINFQNFSDTLLTRANGVRLELNTAIFSNKDFPVKKSFEALLHEYYKVALKPVNFKSPTQAASFINEYVAQATRNRIPVLVSTSDVSNAQVFLTSILYFKGQWKRPFNVSASHRETFYDEKNMKIGEVDMMYQTGIFPYSRIEEIKAHVLELPYGANRKMSMVVILPFKGQNIAGVLNSMIKVPFSSIITSLEEAEQQFVDEDVHVYLPRFKISSDFNLNIVLNKMGIKDVFDLDKANLLGMFDHYLYLSRLIQKAEIEVNEDGTVASAASGGFLQNKSQPPRFRANKPFLYFIVEKSTKSIVFAGKVSNPDIPK